MPFAALGLSPALVRATASFSAPTPVQAAAIPAALGGGDLMATARTGSGKTLAFVLPLLERWSAARRTTPRRLHTLILVPTRELAAQVSETVRRCASHLPERLKVVSAVGGLSINPQMMALRGGADFVIATPGRLLDLVDQNALNLSHVSALVLDEADRLLDLGFAKELARIHSLLPPDRQNLLFSATFPPAVRKLAADSLRQPTVIEIADEPAEIPLIRQRAIEVDTAKRTPLLVHLLKTEGWSRVLVFVAKKYSASHVADKLRRHGIPAVDFHGELAQGARSQALDDFKNSRVRVLVATDLAARGLDIAQLPVVLNYDLPRSTTDFIHRIGRTGRAGEPGLAVSFVTAESHAHFLLIEKRHQTPVPRERIAGFEPESTPPPPLSGGIKGRRKSKKDKLREAAARRGDQNAPPAR
jgi:ATP-dependent RNA helicase RhlE